MPTDRFDQYAEDQPTFTQALTPYQWQEPRAWRTGRSGGGRPVLLGTGGTAGAFGGGRASPQGKGFMADTGTDRFVRRWRESEARADRIRAQYAGERDWTGSEDDYNDAISPDHSGGLDAVVNGPRQAGSRKDEGWDSGSPLRAASKPSNGNGLSGGVAQVHASAGGYL
jgi:hypothetical protein